MKPIDDAYFKDYVGNGTHYKDVYQNHSGILECCDVVQNHYPAVKTVLVLGSATGQVLQDFSNIGIRPFGCEINRYAFLQTPDQFKEQVYNLDMRQFVPALAQQGIKFDLIFSNSLVYLDENEIDPFIKLCSHITRYFHFYSSFQGHAADDPYRVTLKPYGWWNQIFLENGFCKTPWSMFMWEKIDA